MKTAGLLMAVGLVVVVACGDDGGPAVDAATGAADAPPLVPDAGAPDAGPLCGAT